MSDTWHGCYRQGWQGAIVPEAFSHPAKMSRSLIRRIFTHAMNHGWIAPGDHVLDPFGGIGATGIEGAYVGLRVTCVELEPKFVDLARQNCALHRAAWETLGCPEPVMLLGDSRRLVGAMPEGRFDACVGSPPWEGVMPTKGDPKFSWKFHGDQSKYGEMAGQFGREFGDTFWSAAREVLEQCRAVLRPGGHAIWACKDFVRKGQRVPFSDRWAVLCESTGFRLVCRHRAMLVERRGVQGGMFGEERVVSADRKSFFRRLAERKGSPAIDWEDVLCLERE